jgi:hypothetical protein
LARRAACLILCSAFLTACGSVGQPSRQDAETNTSTESEACLPRGTSLVSVTALPGRKPLSGSSVTAIELQEKFAFAITVMNSGCATEKQVGVQLALSAGEPRFAGEGQIDEIEPGEEKTVVIGNLPLPPLDRRLVLSVEVAPVPAETKAKDNSAAYPVKFVVG